MALIDLKVRNAKHADKPQKLFDANGVFLYIPKANKTGKLVKNFTKRSVPDYWR